MAVPAFAPLVLMAEKKKRASPPSDPESELTAIASSSKRRRRQPPPSAAATLDCEIDALIDSHAEQLRAGVGEIHRRQCELFAAAVEARVREREAQAERLWIENAALQARLQAASLQNQQLLAVARRSEAVAAALRGSLEAVVRQNEVAAREREGFGDSGDVGDVDSCCGGGEAPPPAAAEAWRWRCRVCGEREVSVMLMPCQHLCLCRVCEVVAGECPCCRQPKCAALQVFL